MSKTSPRLIQLMTACRRERPPRLVPPPVPGPRASAGRPSCRGRPSLGLSAAVGLEQPDEVVILQTTAQRRTTACGLDPDPSPFELERDFVPGAKAYPFAHRLRNDHLALGPDLRSHTASITERPGSASDDRERHTRHDLLMPKGWSAEEIRIAVCGQRSQSITSPECILAAPCVLDRLIGTTAASRTVHVRGQLPRSLRSIEEAEVIRPRARRTGSQGRRRAPAPASPPKSVRVRHLNSRRSLNVPVGSHPPARRE